MSVGPGRATDSLPGLEQWTGRTTTFWEHDSFLAAERRWPELAEIRAFRDVDLARRATDDTEGLDAVWSSYKTSDYGHLFYGLMRVLRPETCVEIGVLHGYSLIVAAAGLRDNGRGIIHGHDLFEQYPYRHADQADVAQRLAAVGVCDYADIRRLDAWDVADLYDRIDVLHVDVSNNGDTYRRMFAQWHAKVSRFIILEGGAPARDRVDWMLKYDKAPIAPVIDELERSCPEWEFAVLAPYPSLTLARRRE